MSKDQAGWITIGPDAVTVRIIARPGSTRRRIVRIDPRGLVVALHSPPANGRANDELVEHLAQRLKLPRTAITLVRGTASRTKTVRIISSHPSEIAGILSDLIPDSR